MSTFFFYTDPSLISGQVAEQAFGPILSTPPNPEQFQLTHWHSIASGVDLPIVAVCDGVLCAQYDPTGNINLILKPDYQPLFDYPFIKYFVYRGIDPDSLVSGTEIIANGATLDNDLTKRLRTNWLSSDDHSDLTESYKALGLDRTATFKTTANHEIFKDDQPIDHLFLHEHTVQLAYVLRGDIIAYAKDRFGFGIIKDHYGQLVPLSEVRKAETMIDVPANPTTEVERLKAKLKAETTLNYLDPVTFFAGFWNFKLKYVDAAQKKTKLTKSDKKDLIYKFYNKSKVYIYPRHTYNFRTEATAVQIMLNGNLIATTAWPILIADNIQHQNIEINIINWTDMFMPALNTQAGLKVRGSMYQTQSYLFGQYSEEYFHSNEDVQIDINCSKLFLNDDSVLLPTHLELFIREDDTIDSIEEFVLPSLEQILHVRPSYLHYSYDTIFKSTLETGFDNYEAYFSGAFFNDKMSVIFYTPILSKHYDNPKTRAFINENYECANADFFDTFFAQKHVLIKNQNPDSSYYCSFIPHIDSTYESLLDENFSNYYDGFTTFAFTPSEYVSLKSKVDNLGIKSYRFFLEDITTTGIDHYRKYQLKLLYYDISTGFPEKKVDDLSDLSSSIHLITNVQYENHFFFSTNFMLTDDLIHFLDNPVDKQTPSRRGAPPLTSRLFAEDKILNAINRGQLVLDDDSYAYFDLIGRTEFVTKIFQAIAIAWPELPGHSGSSVADRISTLENIWLNHQERITINHLHLVLDQLKDDISYYFSLAHTESGQELIEYFPHPLEDNIDYKLIIFLDEELNRIQIYNEKDSIRPRAIFNLSEAKAIGDYSLTWKSSAYFDYAFLCHYVLDFSSTATIEDIRNFSTSSTPTTAEAKKLEKIALSLILMDKLERAGLVELGSGPTDKFINLFYADSQKHFFDDFYNPSNYISNWNSNVLYTSEQAYHKSIDRLFYFLIHYAVPKIQLNEDFFYHLFYYPEKLENFTPGYAPVEASGTLRQVEIAESIEIFEALQKGVLSGTKYLKFLDNYRVNLETISDHWDSLSHSIARSFCERLVELQIESKYLKAHNEPEGKVIAYLPVNRTLYLDFVQGSWLKVTPEAAHIEKTTDQILYLHPSTGKYHALFDHVIAPDHPANGVIDNPLYVKKTYQVKYPYYKIKDWQVKKYEETYDLKPNTLVQQQGLPDGMFYLGQLVNLAEVEISEPFSGYYVDIFTVRLTSPCPAPFSLLYKVKKHNIGGISGGQYTLALRSHPEDQLLDVAKKFYGTSSSAEGYIKDQAAAGSEEEKDNRFFANVIFYANNPDGYQHQIKYYFSQKAGGFITNELDPTNNIEKVKLEFSYTSALPVGLSLDAETGEISGEIGGSAQTYSDIEITVKEIDVDGTVSNNQTFTFNWKIDPAGTNTPPDSAKPEDQYNCLGDKVSVYILAKRPAAIYHTERTNFKGIENFEVKPINELSFAWNKAELIAGKDLWIPSYQHAISLVDVVPDGSIGNNLKPAIDGLISGFKEEYLNFLDKIWPIGTGLQLSLGIGVTLVYPVGIDGDFLFYILREDKTKFKIVRRGSIAAGLDTSAGVGFYAGAKSKYRLKGKRSGKDHGLGVAVRAEASARVMGGLLVHEEYAFDLGTNDNKAFLAFNLLLSSVTSFGGNLLVSAFRFLDIDPYDYANKIKFAVTLTASAEAAATAKVALIKKDATKRIKNKKDHREEDYTEKAAGWPGKILKLLNLKAEAGASLHLDAGFGVEISYENKIASNIEVAAEAAINAEAEVSLPSFLSIIPIPELELNFSGGISFSIKGYTALNDLMNTFVDDTLTDSEKLAKLPDFIYKVTFYTYGGELDYFDGMPAYRIGVEVDVKATTSFDFSNWENLADVNLANVFVEQRIAKSLSISVKSAKELLGISTEKASTGKKTKPEEIVSSSPVKLSALNGYLGLYYKTNAKLSDIIGFIINDLIPLIEDVKVCVEEKTSLDIKKSTDPAYSPFEQLVFNLQFLLVMKNIFVCLTEDKRRQVKDLIFSILGAFLNIEKIVCVNYDSLSFAAGGKIGLGAKARLEGSIEAGVILEFELKKETAFKAADLIWNWMQEKYLSFTEKI